MAKIDAHYRRFSEDITRLLVEARRRAASSINAVLTTTYWEIGRRVVHFEQGGRWRAGYGEAIVPRLSADLTRRFGRGFSERNIEQMRLFYLKWPNPQTVSAKSGKPSFSLSWSHYVLLMSVDNQAAVKFYEMGAFSGGWSVRQLERQIGTQYYERTLLSKNKAAMLTKGSVTKPGDLLTPEEEIKDPTILEFLNLKDEYSESDLEEALILHLEHFLLEMGAGFAFIARQKRLRVGDAWYRVDLVLFHRRLKCLVLIDLKLSRFTHADAGQMHLYLNYARENWTMPGENPPVGLILCAKKDQEVAHYALEGLRNKVLASEYKTTLPDAKQLAAEIQRTQRALETKIALRRRVAKPHA